MSTSTYFDSIVTQILTITFRATFGPKEFQIVNNTFHHTNICLQLQKYMTPIHQGLFLHQI